MDFSLSIMRRLAAVGLLVFLVLGAAMPWMLDLVTAQRAFGFLLGADLIAFTMLVYVYDRTSDRDVNWNLLLIGSAIIAMLMFFGIVTP
jgi:hypothetical protein